MSKLLVQALLIPIDKGFHPGKIDVYVGFSILLPS